jgi:DNA-binding MarR family transcriptional regulator
LIVAPHELTDPNSCRAAVLETLRQQSAVGRLVENFGFGILSSRLPNIGLARSLPSDFEAQSLGEVLSFMRLLWAVAHGLESASKRMLGELGVTGPQRLVLRLLGHYETLSPGDLSELLHVHPSSLTGVLRRLEKARLISRKTHPEDRRRAMLGLTAKGRAINARRAGTVEAAVRRTLDATPGSRIEATQKLLQRLSEELDR